MRRPTLLAVMLGVALLGLALFPGDAAAHRGGPPALVDIGAPDAASAPPFAGPAMLTLGWSTAPLAAPVPWPLAAGIVTLLALGARRPRRALALTLLLLLALLAFETGVHSVHHLVERDGGQHCAVASAAQHLTGTEVPFVLVVDLLPQAQILARSGAPVARLGLLGPDQGRAPPTLLA